MTNLEFYKEEIISKMYGGNSANKVVSDLFWEHHDSEKGETSLRCVLDWLCDEHQILNEKEKEYLSAVIRPFKDKIFCIEKHNNKGFELEEILIFYTYDNSDSIAGLIELPKFKENTMYKGMEVGRRYTAKELGL